MSSNHKTTKKIGAEDKILSVVMMIATLSVAAALIWMIVIAWQNHSAREKAPTLTESAAATSAEQAQVLMNQVYARVMANETNLVGVWQGIFPCADCAGIWTIVALVADSPDQSEGTYEIISYYMGANFDPSLVSGTWSRQTGTDLDQEAKVVALWAEDGEAAAYYQIVDDGEGLTELDLLGQVIENAAANPLSLVQAGPLLSEI